MNFPKRSGRSGIVTQVSMLAMFSHPGRSLAHQARRGPDGHLPVRADAHAARQCRFFHRQRHQRARCRRCASGCWPMPPRRPAPPATPTAIRSGCRLEHFDSVGQRRLTGKWPAHRCVGHHQGKTFQGRAGAGPIPARQSQSARLLCPQTLCLWRGREQRGCRDQPRSRPPTKAFVDGGYRLRALLKSMVDQPGILQRAAARRQPANWP